MKLSVIVLTYEKYHKYLTKCLDSIEFYDPLNLEIIVVNNSETRLDSDGTINLINISPVEVGKARNIGFGHSTGDTILFLDGDDWLFPNALNFLYGAWQQNQDKIIFGSLMRGDTDTVYTPEDDYLDNQANRPYCCLIPRSVFEKIQFDEELQSWEDLDYEIKTKLAGVEQVRIDSVIYYYRWSETSRRSLMDEGAEGFDPEIYQTVYNKVYNNNMACNTCGKKTVRVNPIRTASAMLTIPEFSPEYDLYLEYVEESSGGIVNRRVLGSETNTTYRFSNGNPREKFRKIVDNNNFNSVFEIHITDAQKLLDLQFKGKPVFIIKKVLKEVVKNVKEKVNPEKPIEEPDVVEPVEEPIFETIKEDVELPFEIDTMSISKMRKWLQNNTVDPTIINKWLETETRVGMVKLLNDYL